MNKFEFHNELACPKCRTLLSNSDNSLFCAKCGGFYPIKDGIPVFSEQYINKDVENEHIYWNEKTNDESHLYENLTDRFLRQLTVIFNLPDEGVGFELGCGDGPFAKRLKDRKSRIYGLDISIPLLKLTDNMIAVQGNALELPFQDNLFNWIIYAFALHHMVDLEKAFLESLRVLQIGGKIIIIEPNYYHPVRFITRKPETFFRKHFFKYLSPSEKWIPVHRIKSLFNRNKIKTEEILFFTPEFTSNRFLGKIQKWMGIIFCFWPFNVFFQSYYLIIGKKTNENY